MAELTARVVSAGQGAAGAAQTDGQAQHAPQARLTDAEEEVEDHGGGGEQAEGRRVHGQRQRSAGRAADLEPREAALHHRARHPAAGAEVRGEGVGGGGGRGRRGVEGQRHMVSVSNF